MMKIHSNIFKQAPLLIFLLLLSFSSFSQNFKTEIEKYREAYKNAFSEETGSPLKKEDLINLSFFKADSSYAINAKIELLTEETPFLMSNYSGNPQQYIRYARLKFTLNGKPQELTIYKSIVLSQLADFKDYLFLPFTDFTNGKDTYSGGRYIDLNRKDIINDRIKVDFNKAYNPYCAYSDGYQCPKPPTENRIQQNINVGEMVFSGAKK